MIFELETDRLSLSFLDEFNLSSNQLPKEFNGHPYCEFILKNVLLSYNKFRNREAEFRLISKYLNGNFFEYIDESHGDVKVFKRGFLQDLKVTQKSLNEMIRKNKRYQTHLLVANSASDSTPKRDLRAALNERKEIKNPSFQLIVNMYAGSRKKIDLFFSNTKMSINMGLLSNLATFTATDDSLQIVRSRSRKSEFFQ